MPPEAVKPLLAAAAARLARAGSETPALDARLLLQAAAGLSWEEIILGPDRIVPQHGLRRFEEFLLRRARLEPVSRILGVREFHGRTFRITPDVLDPRPDTEVLTGAALALMPQGARLLDLGTGSGCIAVTLLAERPDATGTAVDVSPAALAVAAENALAHGVAERLQLRQGSWFGPAEGRFDVIVSNPPYIPLGEIAGLAPAVRDFDPVLALAGGPGGLDCYRAIAAGAAAHLAPGGHVLVEIGAGQAEDVTAIFSDQGFRLASRHDDLGGHVRCLAFRR